MYVCTYVYVCIFVMCVCMQTRIEWKKNQVPHSTKTGLMQTKHISQPCFKGVGGRRDWEGGKREDGGWAWGWGGKVCVCVCVSGKVSLVGGTDRVSEVCVRECVSREVLSESSFSSVSLCPPSVSKSSPSTLLSLLSLSTVFNGTVCLGLSL